MAIARSWLWPGSFARLSASAGVVGEPGFGGSQTCSEVSSATGSNSVCLLAAPVAEPLRACERGKATFGVRGKGYSGAVRWGRAISSSCAGEVVVGCSERELGQLRAVRGGQRFGPVLGQPLLGGRPRCLRA